MVLKEKKTRCFDSSETCKMLLHFKTVPLNSECPCKQSMKIVFVKQKTTTNCKREKPPTNKLLIHEHNSHSSHTLSLSLYLFNKKSVIKIFKDP